MLAIHKGDTLSYGKSVKTDIVATSEPFENGDLTGRFSFFGLVCGKASTDIQEFFLDQVTKNYTTGEVA
jgi:hypothetical protein